MGVSRQEAISIAQNYVDGIILKSHCDAKINPVSQKPISWIVNIYHQNEDEDTFKTQVEILLNGTVSYWEKEYFSD